MHRVRVEQTANALTANVPAYIGSHVAYTCDVDDVVTPTVFIGQCGRSAEPVDLSIVAPAALKMHKGDRFRVLGIVDRPGSWADIYGHVVYYPFIKAVFVDPVSNKKPL